MTRASRRAGIVVGCLTLFVGNVICGQDWPQWRGPHRDAKATGFAAPQVWPKSLTKKWKVNVGDGVATPALVGDRLYVFARRDADEVACCLDATTGKELWTDRYAVKGASGPASQFPGPRSSPTVADGKVVTLGVRGTLSCLDAASGKKLWRKTEPEDSLPRFFTSCSPIVVDGLCIVQFGGEEKGGVVAYDLASGDEKWKWTGDGTAYASPDLLTMDGVKMLVAMTAKNIVGLGTTDGKLLWEIPFSREAWVATTQPHPSWMDRQSTFRAHFAALGPSKSKNKATAIRRRNSGRTRSCPCNSTRRSSRTACSTESRAATFSFALTPKLARPLGLLIVSEENGATARL
jgi:hypothetical protein